MKTRKFAFRIAESDYQMLKTKAKRGKITMTEFLLRAITDKEIIVVDGVKEMLGELKAIGRNLNQLTILANMDRIDTVYLTETKAQLNEIYEKISSICEVEQ
ncbi:MAG: plasmid mobilization relaxosome protein MobC [Christensenella sp.]